MKTMRRPARAESPLPNDFDQVKLTCAARRVARRRVTNFSRGKASQKRWFFGGAAIGAGPIEVCLRPRSPHADTAGGVHSIAAQGNYAYRLRARFNP